MGRVWRAAGSIGVEAAEPGTGEGEGNGGAAREDAEMD